MRVEGQLVLNGTTQMLNAALGGLGLAYVPADLVEPHLAHFAGRSNSMRNNRRGRLSDENDGRRHGIDDGLDDGIRAARLGAHHRLARHHRGRARAPAESIVG